jgi:hypothetical protein
MPNPYNPVHAVVLYCQDAEAQQRPLFEENQNPWPGMVASSLAIDIATLQRFCEALVARGETLDATRFFLDPAYAYQRLAAAHCADDPSLKALSLMFFERYQALDQRRCGHEPTAH